MAVFQMEIAGMTFCIRCVHDYAEKLCHAYLIPEKGEHEIIVTQEEIDWERQHCKEKTGIDNALGDSPDPYLETICLLRKLANYITGYHRVLMHGSAISVNGKGYIFTAQSGTGKSTHTALLRKLLGDQAVMINDDKPFLHITPENIFVCGTPWMGKHNLGNNVKVPLAGIFFLHRSEENVLNVMEPNQAVRKLIGQCHRPEDPVQMINSLAMFDEILNQVPLYDFGCNTDISAAELSSSVMK